jgi:branched-chain amino acid transport system ATP-binding protein
MLEIDRLEAFYGDFQALFGVDLRLAPGEVLALVGANGAGKTSLLQAICGLTEARGRIVLDGRDLGGLPVAARARFGVALSPEGRRMFVSLSVRENLLMGAHVGRPGPWSLDTVYALFPILREFAERPAGLLSGGQQQMVAIGRALMTNPALLLLDEVSLGLAPVVAHEVLAAVASLKGRDRTMTILVEQDVGRALSVADRFLCLLEGRAVLSGTAAGADLNAIGRAYFGEDAA